MVKLVMAIVQNSDAKKLNDVLLKEGLKTTFVSTTGGFLKEGNSTFLIGVDPDRLEKVIEIIKNTCQKRERMISSAIPAGSILGTIPESYPTKIVVGGATIFVVDAEKV
ncbi:MAG: hypothetical protein AUJ85_02490 [Elusimicrobia bacterium CG1_02_37_114]|nr:MAG: hypothetical protein AUJ85_02490 [Elusimicrobia bacterium CG1_02_37_114]PIV52626.1 MAG: hypothetical protein COS17_08175 [Elusimicrobia bacterium CG02_land_8_20_14_3_00_37_13]PIZ13541.1 MAG: hypothetical protein COY53_04280 [Elusimicrobia bacterium CG_4_10_14_0_8_um_filter_37_32]